MMTDCIKLIYWFEEVINLGTDDRALNHMAVRILDHAHEAIYSKLWKIGQLLNQFQIR